ncbi:Tripartite-type tricarboxylate transporter, receptor component TctC [Bosea sp. OK403]|uniref:Bug family tripartite tricarboxylate transporter substrate binding protein n=1 Tax=Bosea sp. OK403 TaxID=1855286 RepID=UPI0008E10373|nr:tripartite tricarboxylate transporter substrate binding protein [Bosea sp. OK403]SFI37946.1 Tripartite-type tricarboxylate transporter, receptor component TctC [Bosea sp. OK403]
MLKRSFLGGALAALAFAGMTPALSQAYPTRPITLIVPYAPGGATDIIGRVIAEEVSHTIGQRVVVENRAGAAGSVGAAAVARAQPDGYTLLMGALTSHSINMGLQAKPGFDLKKDFAPVTLAGTVGLALVVHPSVQAKTIPELVALAKARPDDFNYASSGNGSPQHLAGEMFNARAGTKLGHVAYRGSGPAMTDMIGGQVKVMFDTIPSVLQHVNAGSLKAIATTGREPSPFMPDYPTAISQGLADFEIGSWFGVLAPAGTPQPVIDKLNTEIGKALRSSRALEAMKLQGVAPKPGTPAEAAALIDSEMTKWNELIKATGIKPE